MSHARGPVFSTAGAVPRPPVELPARPISFRPPPHDAHRADSHARCPARSGPRPSTIRSRRVGHHRHADDRGRRLRSRHSVSWSLARRHQGPARGSTATPCRRPTAVASRPAARSARRPLIDGEWLPAGSGERREWASVEAERRAGEARQAEVSSSAASRNPHVSSPTGCCCRSRCRAGAARPARRASTFPPARSTPRPPRLDQDDPPAEHEKHRPVIVHRSDARYATHGETFAGSIRSQSWVSAGAAASGSVSRVRVAGASCDPHAVTAELLGGDHRQPGHRQLGGAVVRLPALANSPDGDDVFTTAAPPAPTRAASPARASTRRHGGAAPRVPWR